MARPPNSYFNNNYYKQLNKFGIQIDSSIAENPYPCKSFLLNRKNEMHALH